ncbi:MAG: divalent metal cation transporter [Gemmatimonadetes bacterium]|nr:MAG: divalent metal cation transporter [Gemmatimonadota bacterium]
MSNQPSSLKGLVQSLGPGLIMAGAAIGVSHLVQSTRAGASFGFALVWAIVLANIFKYPSFEFGPRYAAGTGKNLLHGYQKVGTWALAIYLLFTFCTMFIVEAALVVVTAGLTSQLFGITTNHLVWSGIILLVCLLILMLGRYPLLDKLMKIMVVFLSISTLFAVIVLVVRGEHQLASAPPATYLTPAGIAFIVALMGWMPSIVDISVWHSVWTIERAKETGHQPLLREALFDFNLGYISTAILALLFLSLGALLMYNSGIEFSNSSAVFAGQLVELFRQSLGAWITPIISVTALVTMFSTTLTVTDAYPRVLTRALEITAPTTYQKVGETRSYFFIMLVLITAGLLVVAFLAKGIKTMVDIATTVSFLTTPVLAYINHRVVTSPDMPTESAPPRWLRLWSWLGIFFWAGFAVFFLYVRFGFR